MKKFIALTLVMCLTVAAFPVFAESTEESAPSGSELGDLATSLLELFESGNSQEGGPLDKLSGLIGRLDTDKIKDVISGLNSKLKDGISSLLTRLKDGTSKSSSKFASRLSAFKERIKETGLKDGISGLRSKLKEDMAKALADRDEKTDSLLSALKEKLSADDSVILKALMDRIHGRGDSAESYDDDKTLEEELAETIEKLNREAEAETGAGVANKKEATSADQFYGHWKQVKFVIDGMEFDMSDTGEGAYFGENTYYTTSNGEKSEDYLYPETAEVFVRDGVLKVNCNGNWTTYVMTEDGQIVIPGSGLDIYFARVEE